MRRERPHWILLLLIGLIASQISCEYDDDDAYVEVPQTNAHLYYGLYPITFGAGPAPPDTLGAAGLTSSALSGPIRRESSAGTAGVPYRPFLLRQANCSLTVFALDASGKSLSTYTNYQDYLHRLSGLSSLPDRFATGCKDPTIGIMSQQAFSLGQVANGNVAFGVVNTSGVSVALMNSATFAHISTTQYASVPSPNPDTLAPLAATAADLNHDGIVDVVVVNSGSGNPWGTVSIFLGNGDGTLKAPTTISLPIQASAVTVEDVNNDGKLDLVVLGFQPSSSSGGLLTLLGKGDGTFQAPISGPAGVNYPGNGTLEAAIADFNNDGKKDLVANTGQVFLGKGDGTFTLQPQLAFPVGPSGVGGNGLAAGDVNHDGKVDLAISNGPAESIDVYMGNGDGTFVFKASYVTIYGAGTVTITDMDGDGNPDIFVGGAQGGLFGQDAGTHGAFHSLLGRGDGTFVAAINYSANSAAGTLGNAAEFGSGFDVADFNGDGKPDIVRLDANNSGPLLTVLTGQGDGSFQAGPQTPITLAGLIQGLVAADFNRDGKQDVVFASGNSVTNAGSISVVAGNGNGTFQAQVNYAVQGVVTGLAVADVNGDGFPDVVAATGFFSPYAGATQAQLYLLLNNGDGTFKPATLIDAKSYLFQVAAADVNGDGHVDLVVTAGGNLSSKIPGTVYLYLGKGDGTFQPATQLNVTGSNYPASVAIADLNKDGKPDVVITDFQSGNLLVLLGNGGGTFQSPIVTKKPSGAVTNIGIGIADLDGDGTPDILLPGLFYSAGFKGNGDGTFTPAGPLWLAPSAGALKFVDVNGDGQPDILASSSFVGLHVLLSSTRNVPLINQGGVVNGGSFAIGQPIGPGGFVSLFGSNLSSQTALAAAIPLPTTLNQVSVTINGEAAALYFVSSGQINVQAPWDLSTSGPASVVVTNNGVSSPAAQVATAADSPAVLNDGAGHAIAINLDGKLAAAPGAVPGLTTHPAKRGQAIIIYATGLGPVDHAIPTGGVPPSGVLVHTTSKPAVLIGGTAIPASDLLFSGLTPQFVGVNQVNIIVPLDAPTGNAVPLQIQMGGFTSPATVTFAVE